jgi:lipoyl(octanoyl) transferase
LADVRAGSIETARNKQVIIHDEIPGLVSRFGRLLDRELRPMDLANEGEIGEVIAGAEEDAIKAGDWAAAPLL